MQAKSPKGHSAPSQRAGASAPGLSAAFKTALGSPPRASHLDERRQALGAPPAKDARAGMAGKASRPAPKPGAGLGPRKGHK